MKLYRISQKYPIIYREIVAETEEEALEKFNDDISDSYIEPDIVIDIIDDDISDEDIEEE